MTSSLHIDADFEGGSAGDIKAGADGVVEVMPQPEQIPAWFFDALNEHFGGAGVPREYACHVRVVNDSEAPEETRLRFRFTATNGASYMAPPYWILRHGRWWPIPAEDTDFVDGSHVDLILRLEPGELVHVANKPYVHGDDVLDEMETLARYGPFNICEVGRSAGDRPIVALESTGFRYDDTILIGATMQPAEPAARPVLAIAHWLTDGSALSQRLLERFRFAFVPLPNPDGAADGRSCTNGVGEVPMFSFGRLLAGEEAPAETRALWDYAAGLRPLSYLEFHTHYQDVREHKLNPMAAEWFAADVERQQLLRQVDTALLALNQDWRVTPIERATPLCLAGKFANLADRFATLSYCYQIYTITEEATCAHAVSVARTLATALAGPEWAAEAPTPNVTRG
jgi:hypothetical protein